MTKILNYKSIIKVDLRQAERNFVMAKVLYIPQEIT